MHHFLVSTHLTLCFHFNSFHAVIIQPQSVVALNGTNATFICEGNSTKEIEIITVQDNENLCRYSTVFCSYSNYNGSDIYGIQAWILAIEANNGTTVQCIFHWNGTTVNSEIATLIVVQGK